MHPLQRVLYKLSDHDPLTASTLVEALLITGAPGSGKSSTTMKQIVVSVLRAGYGGLFLSAKSEDTRDYIQYVKDAWRADDLIVFGPDSGHTLDPLHYLWNRPGKGSATLETIVDMFTLLMAIGGNQSSSHEPFWERAAQQLMRAAIVILHLATRPISIKSIDDMIADYPTFPGQHETPEWQTGTCAEALAQIKDRRENLRADEWSNFARALHFVCVEWPAFDSRARSSVLATWTSLADKFLYEPFLSLFSSGKCTFIPEDVTQANRIIIVDFPAEQGDASRIATCLVKLIFQEGFLRRDIERQPTPSFVVSDECQLYVLPKGRDERFLQICRSKRICSILATQNIMQLAAEFGESALGPKTKGWLANIGTRIALQQNDPDTNEQLADVIGKVWQSLPGSSVGPQHASLSTNLQLGHRLLPTVFAALQKPDTVNPFAEAIVYSSGRNFNATKTQQNPDGEPYLLTAFSRDLK